MDTDVLVVGAGPTGLLLANELQLAGADALVLERLPQRSGQSKALNLQPRTAEILQLRGWLEPVLDRAMATIPGGHFAGLPLDYGVFDTPFPYQVGIPQARVEESLEQRLAACGTPVRYGHELLDIRQDGDGVTAEVAGPDGRRQLRARYLVGADGGRCTVRQLLGAAFPGRDGRISAVVADVLLDGGETAPAEWRLPDFEPDENGVSFLLPLGDGVYRLLFGGPAQQGVERSVPVGEDEVRAALRLHHGDTVRLRELRWASRFTDASRQVEHYRAGRVLLAGDAAHIHLPAGGQGLNLGMQDAFNLGWKLAAELHGRAPELVRCGHDGRRGRPPGPGLAAQGGVRRHRRGLPGPVASPPTRREPAEPAAGRRSGRRAGGGKPQAPPHRPGARRTLRPGPARKVQGRSRSSPRPWGGPGVTRSRAAHGRRRPACRSGT
ncbi:FAD-dependent monooxygenase [Saccharothrix sp. ST-888]|uniref:FAD-dependent monooxygenase n=1 Tax=Saccharothrix sp. ST-888 TaxID=1427391 RepID=UPI0006964025|nr:FAD-dependent monooxygenase [Saccharothrix sp. ST-888]